MSCQTMLNYWRDENIFTLKEAALLWHDIDPDDCLTPLKDEPLKTFKEFLWRHITGYSDTTLKTVTDRVYSRLTKSAQSKTSRKNFELQKKHLKYLLDGKANVPKTRYELEQWAEDLKVRPAFLYDTKGESIWKKRVDRLPDKLSVLEVAYWVSSEEPKDTTDIPDDVLLILGSMLDAVNHHSLKADYENHPDAKWWEPPKGKPQGAVTATPEMSADIYITHDDFFEWMDTPSEKGLKRDYDRTHFWDSPVRGKKKALPPAPTTPKAKKTYFLELFRKWLKELSDDDLREANKDILHHQGIPTLKMTAGLVEKNKVEITVADSTMVGCINKERTSRSLKPRRGRPTKES